MAAVLINTCGDLCRLPCELFGKACGATCQCLESVCGSLGQACGTPFSIFVTVAMVFNLPCVYIGLMLSGGSGFGDWSCQGSQWLIIDGLLCLVNVAASVYMAVVVAQQPLPPTPQLGDETVVQAVKHTTAFSRAGHLLCYDPWMAGYILIILGFFVWLWLGGIWSLNGKIHNGCNSNDTSVSGRVAVCLAFGWAFFFFGCGALAISMCCAYCWGSERDGAVASTTYYKDGTTTSKTPYVNADSLTAKAPNYSTQQQSSSEKPQWKPTPTDPEAPATNNTTTASAPPTEAASSQPTTQQQQQQEDSSLPVAQAVLF